MFFARRTFETMRAPLLFIWMLIWGLRLADPVAHSLLHGHHEHCAEQGQHLHEGDDACSWADPAYLVGIQPPAIGWEAVALVVPGLDHPAAVSGTKRADMEWVAPRGPPVG